MPDPGASAPPHPVAARVLHASWLQAGALAAFLREMLMSQSAHTEALEADLQRCLELHFADMPPLVPGVPGALRPGTLERLQEQQPPQHLEA